MPAKISKEVRQRIYELNEETRSVREILGILKSEGIKISDKSIYNIPEVGPYRIPDIRYRIPDTGY